MDFSEQELSKEALQRIVSTLERCLQGIALQLKHTLECIEEIKDADGASLQDP